MFRIGGRSGCVLFLLSESACSSETEPAGEKVDNDDENAGDHLHEELRPVKKIDGDPEEQRLDSPGEKPGYDESGKLLPDDPELPGRTVKDKDLVRDIGEGDGNDEGDRVCRHGRHVEKIRADPEDHVVHDGRQNADYEIGDEFVVKELGKERMLPKFLRDFPARDPLYQFGMDDLVFHLYICPGLGYNNTRLLAILLHNRGKVNPFPKRTQRAA